MGERGGARSKAATGLAGRPLVAWPVAALARVCERMAVVCKRGTVLPDLPGVERWDEPDEPRHPIAGIVHALERAGTPVLVCAADMPFVTEAACRDLVLAFGDTGAAGAGSAAPRAVVAVGAGELEPLLGVYTPAALPLLRAAPPDSALRETVERLAPVGVALPGHVLRSVNTPEDLTRAEAELTPASSAHVAAIEVSRRP